MISDFYVYIFSPSTINIVLQQNTSHFTNNSLHCDHFLTILTCQVQGHALTYSALIIFLRDISSEMGSLSNHPHFQGPPSQLELRSSGEARIWVGNRLGLYQLLPEEAGQDGSYVYKQRHDGGEPNYLYRWDVLLYKGQCNQDCDTNVYWNGIRRAYSRHLSFNHVCLNQSWFKIGLFRVLVQSC